MFTLIGILELLIIISLLSAILFFITIFLVEKGNDGAEVEDLFGKE